MHCLCKGSVHRCWGIFFFLISADTIGICYRYCFGLRQRVPATFCTRCWNSHLALLQIPCHFCRCVSCTLMLPLKSTILIIIMHETHERLSLLCDMLHCHAWTSQRMANCSHRCMYMVSNNTQTDSSSHDRFAKSKISYIIPPPWLTRQVGCMDTCCWQQFLTWTSLCLSRNPNSPHQIMFRSVDLLAPAASNFCSWLTAEEPKRRHLLLSTIYLQAQCVVHPEVLFSSPHLLWLSELLCHLLPVRQVSSDLSRQSSSLASFSFFFPVLAAFRAKSPGTLKSQEISQPVRHQQSHLNQSQWEHFSPFWWVMRR